MSTTDPSPAVVDTDMPAAAAAEHAEEKKQASSSSSTSSENIDEEDDFFQIEGPILGSQFSHGGAPPPAEGGAENAASDECPNPKRIPSSVFARSKSTMPTEWSVTSNESLFSISVGNASFSKDHLFMYGKSGELGNPNDPLAPLPPLQRQSPSSSSSSQIKGEVVAVAPVAAGGQAGSAKVKKPTDDDNADYVHSLSHRSDGSTTSFAFPILTGDATRSGESMKDNNHRELARQSTAQLTPPAEPQDDEKDETPKAEMEAPKVEEAQAPPPPQLPAAAPASTKCFPWCSCCPFCC